MLHHFVINKNNHLETCCNQPSLDLPLPFVLTADIQLTPYGVLRARSTGVITEQGGDNSLNLVFDERQPALTLLEDTLVLFPDAPDDEILRAIRVLPKPVRAVRAKSPRRLRWYLRAMTAGIFAGALCLVALVFLVHANHGALRDMAPHIHSLSFTTPIPI